MSNTEPMKVPAFVDTDKLFDDGVKRTATQAAGDAVLAEIEKRQYELLAAWMPEREDVTARLDVVTKIAADRRKRADALARRAKVKGPKDLTSDVRLFVAGELHTAQSQQVLLDEKFEHIDLYAVSPEEANDMAMRMGAGAPPPETKAQIRLNALQGRSRVQAVFEWLKAHGDDGPDEILDSDSMGRPAGDVLRAVLGKPTKAAAEAEADADADGGGEPAPEPKPKP